MGREVRRVPLDFDWPLKAVWSGFLNPYLEFCRKCPFCDGSGHNPATKSIADDWYDFDNTGRKWSHALTQDEVDALVEENRLWDFTRQWVSGTGWIPRDPPVRPSAAEVNDWSRHGLGHDSINRSICVETRAKRLGVYGKCQHCAGTGEVWRTPADEAAAEAWVETPPPVGDCWQMWENTSEGSPLSPVFGTPEALARWLADTGASAFGDQTASYDEWLSVIKGSSAYNVGLIVQAPAPVGSNA